MSLPTHSAPPAVPGFTEKGACMNTLTRWSTPAALILSSTLAVTAAAGNMNHMSMPGMKMAPSMAMPTSASKPHASAKQGRTTGKVVRIDSTAGTITIAHHKVEGLGWPAMTRTFRAGRPELHGIKAGNRVEFTFEIRNGSAVVTELRKIR